MNIRRYIVDISHLLRKILMTIKIIMRGEGFLISTPDFILYQFYLHLNPFSDTQCNLNLFLLTYFTM